MLLQYIPSILVVLLLSAFPLLSCCSFSNASEIQIYIVHVESPGNAEFLSIENRRSWHESFLPSLHLDSGEPRLVYSYTHVISGFAARLTSEDIKAMEVKAGFLQAQPDQELETMTTYTPAFLGLNQWNGVWWDSDFGAGTIIGVIDTGILPTHPSLSDDGMPLPPLKWRGRCDFNDASLCNNKLIGAMSFKAGYVSSPLDEHGHGTHTASTVVGSQVYDAHVLGNARGSAIGIAPKAHLAIYKVVHDNRGFDSDLLAAIDQAILDGVDVLSISLGRVSEQLYDSAAIIGSFAAMEKGILTCAAAGNAGPYPSVIANDAPWMLTIGASTTDRRITVTVTLGDGMEVEGEAAYQMNDLERMAAPKPIAYPGSNGVLEFKYCRPSALFALDIRGKIVICWADSNGNVEKGIAIKRVGGSSMILLNGPLQSLTTTVEAHALPVAYLSHRESMKLLSYIDLPSNTCPTATIISKGTRFRAQPSPAVASFSSRGPSLINGGILKPDVIGPGVNILAAWSLDISLGQSTPFNFMSGTSVSTAHLTGIAAMLRSTHPEWSPAMIKSAIMTTAYKQDLDGNPIAAEYPDDSPASGFFAMGAGHVNPSAAHDPGLVYDIEPSDYINYLCGLSLTDREVSVIAHWKNIQCSHVQKISVEDLNYPSISLSLELDRKKTITRNATNVGEAHSVYYVHFDEPEGVTMEVTPDMLYFTRKNQKRSFTIEFITTDDFTGRGRVSEGQLSWVNKKHTVRSPISVNFV